MSAKSRTSNVHILYRTWQLEMLLDELANDKWIIISQVRSEGLVAMKQSEMGRSFYKSSTRRPELVADTPVEVEKPMKKLLNVK